MKALSKHAGHLARLISAFALAVFTFTVQASSCAYYGLPHTAGGAWRRGRINVSPRKAHVPVTGNVRTQYECSLDSFVWSFQ